MNLPTVAVTTAYNNTIVEGSIPMTNIIIKKKAGNIMEYPQLIKRGKYGLIWTR